MNYLRYGVQSDGGCSSSFLRDRHHINDDFDMTGVVYFQDKKKIWEVKHWSYEIRSVNGEFFDNGLSASSWHARKLS